MNNSIYKSFEDALGDSAETVISNCLEVGLDVIIENDSIFHDVPFVSTVISIYKIGHTISEIYHIRQLCRFIDEINKGIIKTKKVDKYKSKFEKKDEKEKNKELEYVLLITSKYLDEEKPRWLARTYIAYLDGKIDWKSFISYSEIIDRFLPGDVETLLQGDFCAK